MSKHYTITTALPNPRAELRRYCENLFGTAFFKIHGKEYLVLQFRISEPVNRQMFQVSLNGKKIADEVGFDDLAELLLPTKT